MKNIVLFGNSSMAEVVAEYIDATPDHNVIAFTIDKEYVNGNAFGGNRYQISYEGLSEKARNNPLLDKDIVFASAYMHECGHTLDIINPGVDDQYSKYPWQLNWWKWRPYKSVMNYGYMFLMVDYSDGSRGKYDFDDWNNLDLTAFQRGWW